MTVVMAPHPGGHNFRKCGLQFRAIRNVRFAPKADMPQGRGSA